MTIEDCASRRFLLLYPLLVCCLLPQSLPADPLTPAHPMDRIREDAAALERAGDWERACRAYAELLSTDRGRIDVRERMQYCLRRALITRRHFDLGYRKLAASLTLPQALTVYSDGLTKLHLHYVDREKTLTDRLFDQGTEELGFALDDPIFRRAYLPSASLLEIAAFQAWLHDFASRTLIRSPIEAREAVRDIALAAQRMLRIAPVVAVLEYLCGAANSLDIASGYLTPRDFAAEFTAPLPELAAFGIRVAIRAEQLHIEQVAPDSPAAALAFLRPGDRITRINGRSLHRPTPESIHELFADAVGENLELEVVGSSERDSTHLIRIPLRTPTVLGATMLRDGIGYLRVVSFRDATPTEFEHHLLSLQMRGLRGLILDLRGNPGGLFSIAIQLVQRFLPAGLIVSSHGASAEFSRSWSASGMGTFDLPLVVLIDGDTASAAEIVAGALRDHERAILIGLPSYGKATMQALIRLRGPDEGGMRGKVGGLRMTIARLMLPSGQPFQDIGIIPHIPEANRDRQLDLALKELLRLTTRP